MDAPWAVLLVKFSDDDTEPLPRSHFERVFTSAGAGSGNLVDFFHDVSHGHVDIGNTRVLGWFTMAQKVSQYTGSGANPAGRDELVVWARQAAEAAGEDLSGYVGIVVVTNVSVDLFGGGGQVVTSASAEGVSVTIMGHEMGHGFGLDHSRADGSTADYTDSWDVMSAWNSCYIATHAEYVEMGPGLNAANMRGRGWLDESRVWRSGQSPLDAVIELRPHLRTDLPGFLAAELPSGFLVEFRMNEGWDAAIPRPAVLVHRFWANQSYIMRGTAGQQDLGEGETFESGFAGIPEFPYSSVAVESIDPVERIARVRLRHRAAVRNRGEVAGQILGGVTVDGGGWIIVGGKVVPVPPWDPMLAILEQMALYRSLDAVSEPTSRDLVRRDTLATIARQAASLAAGLTVFKSPPPLTKGKSRR